MFLFVNHFFMSFTDFITNCGKRVRKEYFIHLVNASKVDGRIIPQELSLLHKEGKKFGLTDPEIDKLIESEAKHDYTPPYSLKRKFEHLYNISQMILADEVVTEEEKKMITRFAIEAGFDDKTIPVLIDFLFTGIKNNEDEEELFRKFKKDHLFR